MIWSRGGFPPQSILARGAERRTVVNYYALGLFICIYFFIRNLCVYHFCIEVIRKRFDKYHLLPSYHKMMLRFWEWNFEKFFREEKEV